MRDATLSLHVSSSSYMLTELGNIVIVVDVITGSSNVVVFVMKYIRLTVSRAHLIVSD